ncbi:MAG: ThuA domain-containing protein [Terrimonas sp.]|nr:ThuA domain-containing protein [Terrimonas sp.]
MTKNIISKHSITSFLLLLCSGIGVMAAQKPKPAVLVFYKTAAFYHKSIPAGLRAIQELGRENNFSVDTTNDATQINLVNLKQYKAVIFLSTTGDILNDGQQEAFKQYIRSGGGFMGIHAATDCEYDWSWYGQLVGAYFGGHPAQQTATLHIADKRHPSTLHLPDPWIRKDEWYSFKWMEPGLNILVTIDENSYSLGKLKPMGEHPMAWYHDFDGGRAFYTELGHTEESFSEPLYLQHLLGGIQYTMGKKHFKKMKRKN